MPPPKATHSQGIFRRALWPSCPLAARSNQKAQLLLRVLQCGAQDMHSFWICPLSMLPYVRRHLHMHPCHPARYLRACSC